MTRREELIRWAESVSQEELERLWTEAARLREAYLVAMVRIGLVQACQGKDTLAQAIIEHAESLKEYQARSGNTGR